MQECQVRIAPRPIRVLKAGVPRFPDCVQRFGFRFSKQNTQAALYRTVASFPRQIGLANRVLNPPLPGIQHGKMHPRSRVLRHVFQVRL